MATIRICAIPECGKKHFGRGWCLMHYHRWYKHGDPLYVRRRVRSSFKSPAQMTEYRRNKIREYQTSSRGRAAILRNTYRSKDACDFTVDEMEMAINQPCFYCGTTEYRRGLDRLDNSKGHVKDNVVTSCTLCNVVRGVRFTPEEMKLIGAVINKIRAARPLTDGEYKTGWGQMDRRVKSTTLPDART